MRCRPGELAVIVRCDYRENLGRLIEVLAPVSVSPGGWVTLPNGISGFAEQRSDWLCKSIGSAFLLGGKKPSLYCLCPDSWLRPIRPDADPVETETEREVTA